MTMTSDRIQRRRRIVRSVLLVLAFGMPFLKIHGESALRFDVPSLKLHFFGATIWMDQFFLVLLVVLIVSFLAVFLTILFGRIWCGWACPQTVVVEMTAFVDRMVRKGAAYRIGASSLLLVASILLAADIIWYFVDPFLFLGHLAAGTLGKVEAWSWTVLSGVTFLNFLFLRRTFCATVCPYAKLQGALFDDQTLVIGSDPGRMELCQHCDACVTACPVGIDVRKGLQSECVSCAKCIDACAGRMGRRGLSSLIGYRFGAEQTPRRLMRRSVALSGCATVLFIGLFTGLLLSSVPIDMDISQDPRFPPVRLNDAVVVNTYALLLTNRTDMPQELFISAEASGGPVQVAPNTVVLLEGEHRQVRLALRAEGRDRLRSSSEPVVILAVSRGRSDVRIERKTAMLPPW